MNGLSEDDSSDSSSEFLIGPEKINLNSNFFTEKKTNVAAIVNRSESEEESSSEDDLNDVSEPINVELFTQVLKNLENSQKFTSDDSNVSKEFCVSDSSFLEKEETKDIVEADNNTVASSVEINELLLRGETSRNSSIEKVSSDKTVKNEEDAETEYTIPKEGVKIVLPGTSIMLNKKKKKGNQDLKAILRRRLRASQILVEKVGLLCWLAYGFHLNRQINQPEIMTGVLSLISACNYPKNRIDLKYLEKFTKWFKNVFTIVDIENNGGKRLDKEALLKVLKEKKIHDYKELVLLYVATLRALGLNCRLVISLCPPHRVFSDNPLFKNDSKDLEIKGREPKKRSSKKSTEERKKESSDKTVQNSAEAKKNANAEAKKRAAEILRSKQNNAKKSKTETNSKSKSEKTKEDVPKVTESGSNTRLRQLRSRTIDTNNVEPTATKTKDLSFVSDGTKSKYYIDDDSSDSEKEFQPKPKRVAKKNSKSEKEEAPHSSKTATKKSNRKLISSDSESEESTRTKKYQDLWAEIYLESEESWICASVTEEKIHCTQDVYVSAF